VGQEALLEQVRGAMEKIINSDPGFSVLFPRPTRFRYYGQRGAMGKLHPSNLYAYSVEPVRGKYRSWVYRYIKSRKSWVVSQERGHARRKDAAARAETLYKCYVGGRQECKEHP